MALIKASDSPHPMHMHGSYYSVESVGDDALGSAAGKWIFHCHFLIHTSPEMTVTDGLAARRKNVPENDADHPEMDHAAGNHMAGIVLGITVSGARPPAAARAAPRRLRR